MLPGSTPVGYERPRYSCHRASQVPETDQEDAWQDQDGTYQRMLAGLSHAFAGDTGHHLLGMSAPPERQRWSRLGQL